MTNKLTEQLNFNFATLDKSIEMLKYSNAKAKIIGLKNNYDMEELEVFESLAGRFARSSDILTQKVLKTLFIILQEDARFFIDRCNLCEKLEIIDNADDLYNIRKLRNDIVHEYCTVDITEIFESLLQYTELLLKITDNVKYFITNFRQI